MTKQECLTEQLLLKQRWQLLQNGYNHKQIKIRSNTLIFDNAKVPDDKLVLMSTLLQIYSSTDGPEKWQQSCLQFTKH